MKSDLQKKVNFFISLFCCGKQANAHLLNSIFLLYSQTLWDDFTKPFICCSLSLHFQEACTKLKNKTKNWGADKIAERISHFTAKLIGILACLQISRIDHLQAWEQSVSGAVFGCLLMFYHEKAFFCWQKCHMLSYTEFHGSLSNYFCYVL